MKKGNGWLLHERLLGMSVCQRSCSGTCPQSRSCAACSSSSSSTMQLVAMLLGFPALKSFTRERRACARKSRLNKVCFTWWHLTEPERQTVVTSSSHRPRLPVPQPESHWPKQMCTDKRKTLNKAVVPRWWNQGNELCRNGGKRTGKALWLGTESENIQAEESGKFYSDKFWLFAASEQVSGTCKCNRAKIYKAESNFIQCPGNNWLGLARDTSF